MGIPKTKTRRLIAWWNSKLESMERWKYGYMALSGGALMATGYCALLYEVRYAGPLGIGVGALLLTSAIVGAMWNRE